jgi:hypothetical protein
MFDHERFLARDGVIGTQSRGTVMTQADCPPVISILSTLVALHGKLLLWGRFARDPRLSRGEPVSCVVASFADGKHDRDFNEYTNYRGQRRARAGPE